MATLERKQMILTTYMAVLAMENGKKMATASLSLLEVTGPVDHVIYFVSDLVPIIPISKEFRRVSPFYVPHIVQPDQLSCDERLILISNESVVDVIIQVDENQAFLPDGISIGILKKAFLFYHA
ncbi:hypothetical protein HELRODRAFT_164157 [Helobdella robusta]|uniref:Uncharacterized protein n=1 Tax=Helobdella robusta TaxID=6412 RepID=T1EV05_HELRO|nr:hypothetical protein HELRODRAFT_164157 [Helobdella robusta]ESN94332.1 hypothetical protein HELRODRAFT_164157 [Helobdella robusta]